MKIDDKKIQMQNIKISYVNFNSINNDWLVIFFQVS